MPKILDHVFINDEAEDWACDSKPDHNEIQSFHQRLPGYTETPLVSCPTIARQLGLASVFIKDESLRLGLPAFKILGASWACYREILNKLEISDQASTFPEIATSISENLPALTLYAATDGNHGRAVGRMAKMFGIQSNIYVPRYLDVVTQDLIRSEGTNVIVCAGDYDFAVREAQKQAAAAGFEGLFIQDVAFDGYEEIPRLIVDGYSTMLLEADAQIRSSSQQGANFVICPVGVGSLAMAVVAHYKSIESAVKIITVEPENADCLFSALKTRSPQPVDTGYTIMAGMNCGTVSSIAWPLLQRGVNASVRVSDPEADAAVHKLKSNGVLAGPCGAAPLAALVSLFERNLYKLVGLDSTSSVLLLCTEGERDYAM